MRKILLIGVLIGILGFCRVQVDEEPASVSVIGGADGPTSIFMAGKLRK